MRILVTGSRELTDRDLVRSKLSQFAPARTIVVVCGYDPVAKRPTGADEFAYQWAMDKPWAQPECHPADWGRKCDENCWHPPKFRPEFIDGTKVLVPYCPVAGNVRNTEMVESGIDYYLAFFKTRGRNRGTRDCARKAKAAGIKGERFWSE